MSVGERSQLGGPSLLEERSERSVIEGPAVVLLGPSYEARSGLEKAEKLLKRSKVKRHRRGTDSGMDGGIGVACTLIGKPSSCFARDYMRLHETSRDFVRFCEIV